MAAVAMIVIRQTGPKTTPAGRPAARIVVLPFENLGGGEDGYFAAGITEEITSRLASIRGLAVISRTTATQYDRRGKTVEQIGKDLGVGYVLEGSVRWDKSGGGSGRVRITPQLIRVSDDTHLWTDRYDRQLSSIFAIQGEVADGVIRALNLTIGPSETAALRHVPTRDLDAYDLYLRAGEMWKHQERSAIAEQIRLTAAAFERDPQFAEALALLARGRLLNYWLYYDRRESELERARGEAERAVALRPDSAESHLALGYYNYYGRLDYEAALAEFRKVLALQPNEASVHAEIGYIKRRQGKLEEAEAELQKAFDGDPKNGKIAYNLGETQLLSRKYPEAIRTLDISTLLSPKFSLGYTFQAWAHLLWHGDLAAAERVVQMAAGIQDLGDSDGSLDYFSLRTALLARDWKRALEIVDRPLPVVLSPGLQFQYLPRPLLRAEVQSYAGRQDLAQASYEEARRILVAKLSEDPKDAHFHSSLGIALAGLRQTGEAVREGERAVELMPPEREAYRGILRIEDLALIQTMVGNQEAAIKNLDLLLSRPSWISVPLLRLDPRWDPLRKNPRFESLLAKYEVRL
jgi:serine/threonine-protein kinase